MIEVRVLGSIELGGLGEVERDVLVAHPKRLAVLVYLLLGSPSARVGRESAVTMFWPDTPPARARGSLRTAVHFLRRTLGRTAIRSVGDLLVADRERISCDAWDFQRLVADGSPREAMALYRGSVLEGTAGVGVPGFDIWLEEVRADFDRTAASAAWTLAERAEARRSWISAVDAARRAVTLSGGDERGVRRLMRLLERAGDRVAALEAYDAFAERWRAHHGTDPSEETRALARGLRQRATGGGGPEDGAEVGSGTPAADSPSRGGADGAPGRWAREPTRRLAVLPFLMSGSEGGGEAVAAGIANGLISALSRLSDLRVVARTSVERYREPGSADELPPIAEALGVDTVLQGSIGLSRGRLVLAVQMVDARSGAPTWARIYNHAVDDLLTLQAELATTIVEELGVDLSTTERALLVARPTESAEAHASYLDGRLALRERSRAGLEDAIAAFSRALELDRGFALAHAGLADAYVLLWPISGVRSREARVRAREAARAALRLNNQLGEVHATLGILRGVMEGDWYGAEADFRRAIELSPGYATAHHWYGAYLMNILRRYDDADAELTLARELDPLSPVILVDSGMLELHRGNPAEAIRRLEEALALAPGWWRAHYDLGLARAVAGELEAATDHLESAWRAGAYGTPAPASTERSPPMRDWRARLERHLEELDSSPDGPQSRALDAAVVEVLLDRPDEALGRLETADRTVFALVMGYLPVFRSLAHDPRFSTLLERSGLRPIGSRDAAPS